MQSKSVLAALSAGMPSLGFKAAIVDWLGQPVTLQEHGFWRDYGKAMGGASFVGTRVTEENALKLSTVWACVRLIAETIATLPLGFYERRPDGSRVPATNHPLYEILHNQPNADQTAVVFWEVVVAAMLMRGNNYTEIRRSGQTIIALDFLYPARVRRHRLSNGGVEWRYQEDGGKERTIADGNMMHIPAFSTDGVCGLSPIVYGANVMGTAIETDRVSAETFNDSMKSPGLVMMDALLKKEQREDIRAHVKKVSDDGGIMVLEKGAGFQKIGFDPVSTELLASRRWNAEELCRLYAVDPAMIGIGGKDSNWGTGLEQKMLWFVTLTLRKWCVRIEQAVRRSLLTPVERQRYFAEFAMEGLLRGDSAARAAFYSTMTQNGIFTRDFCRALENQPPMGGNAAVLTIQSNMMPIDKLGEQQMSVQTFAMDENKRHAELLLAMRPAPTPPANITVSPADVRINVPAPAPVDNSAIGAGLTALAAAFAASKDRETPLPKIELNVADGAFRSNVNVEGQGQPGSVNVDSGDVRQALVKHEVLETDHAGLPSKIRQTFVMPDAKGPPPKPEPGPAAGTVLREILKEVIERDANDRILKTRETEIAR